MSLKAIGPLRQLEETREEGGRETQNNGGQVAVESVNEDTPLEDLDNPEVRP